MKAFRIILALMVAGSTFYSLNALAIQYGYPDRLDFRNHHYHEHDCKHDGFRNQSHNHHGMQAPNRGSVKIDSLSHSK